MPSSRPASKGKLLKGRQDRENFLQQIADLTPELLFVVNLKSQEILYVNNRAEKTLGYNASYVYDKGPEILKNLLHPDDFEECLANLKACRKLVEDDETVFDVRLKSANGGWNWFRLKNKVFKRENDGAVSQTIVIAENIQEQKIANEKLKEEHRRLKNAQAIGHIGSFERDLPGNHLFCSEEFYRIHGLEPRVEGISAQQFLSFVHPDDQEALLSAINHSHASGESLNEVTRIIRPDGNVRHVHFRTEIIQNTQGISIREYGTIQDITEQVEAQKKIQYSESLMREAEVVGQFGSYEFDLRSGQLWLSDGFYRLFGYEPKGFEPGLEFIDAVSNPEDAQRVQKVLEQAAQDKQPYEYFRRIFHRNGQMRYLRSNGKVICDAAGNAIKFLGIVEDITDRKQAEENLKEEHRRLKEAQAIGHIGSFEWLKGEDHLYWSEENFRIHGLEPQREPMTLARFSNLIHPEDVPKVKALILQCWEKAIKGEFVYRLIKPDEELRYVNGRFESFADEAGKITHLNGTVQDITEQVKAELELKESKAFAEQITSTTPDLIFIHDVAASNRVIFTNHNYFWKDDFDGDTFYKMQDAERVEAIVHPDDLEKALAFLRERKLLADGEVKEVDLRISEKNAWVRVRSKVFKRDKSGLASQIICFVSDITERKKAEQSLKEAYSELERSNTTVSRMLEGSLAAIVLLDPLRDEKGIIIDFIFKGANKAAETINQKTEAELLGRRMLEIFPAGRNIFFDAFLEVMDTGETIRMERQYKTESLELWVDLSATRNSDGIILTFIDITDRKKAEEQLEENALFIRKVADTTPDILFVFDQEQMRLQYTNKNLKPLLGKNLEPHQAPDLKELLSYVHPKDKEDAITYMRNIAEANDEEVKEVAFRIQNQQGEWRWFHCRGRVFKRSREGSILQHLFIMRDITEEKNTTKALLEAEQLSVKGTMARTIAHEVRVPAANISLSMEMIQKELGDKLTENEEAMIYFNIVTKSCRRISHFINDLISISITEPDAFAETDLGILAEDVLNEAQDRIFLKGVQVERHFSKGYFISADRERLKIAILNIIMNAIEAMEDQQGILQVFIGQEDDKIKITIQDNGSGMTKEQLSRMFDVYYTSKPNGMGVGLANVKAILKDHSAKVKVNSKPGKGTAFNVIFPKLR